MKAKRAKPRSRGRQSAPSPAAGKDQRRLTSAATALREEPVPYRVGDAAPSPPFEFRAPRFIDLFCGIGGFRLP